MKTTDAISLGITFAVMSSALPFVARAELPVPCAGTACSGAGGPQFFYDPGLATPPVNTPTISGNTMTIVQGGDKALLNWQKFNISRDAAVVFQQPGTDSIAFNRVWDPSGNPSSILGRLSANGQIYLINRNGVLFGEGAQVNVHSLVASTLDVADDVLAQGIFAPLRDGRPAFELAQLLDADGNSIPGGAIRIEPGALLEAARNGRIMLLAPEVENRGTIHTPDGQVILAAGQRVWIADSNDPDLRGFVVEVDVGGSARNLGDVLVERGNASLVGIAVNQEGRISASTSVSLGGSIRLVASDTVKIEQGAPVTERAGAVVFGAGSVTEVLPDFSDLSTAVDEQTQPRSIIEATGKTIEVQDAAQLVATSGAIDFTATANPSQPLTGDTAGNGARIDIAVGATLDVSGSEDVVLPMERNVLTVELRGNELKDSPLQRDGILYTEEIKVDVREGTLIADISGALANIQRGIGERTTAGGAIALRSEDALHMDAGAVLDVSGGSIRYDSGLIETTKLVSGGRIYDIGEADHNRRYDAIMGTYKTTSSKWGVTTEYSNSGLQFLGRFEDGYVEGKDAGSMTLLGNSMEIAGVLKGETITGTHQRQLPTEVTLPWRRPADELPLGGQAIFGDVSQLSATGIANFRMPGLIFQSAGTGSVEEGMVVLDPQLFQAGGLSRVAVYSDGRIVLPEDERITLAPGGELTLITGLTTGNASSVPSLQIDGDISIPSGELELRTVQNENHVLTIGANAVLDVSGQWVNDSAAVASTLPSGPIAIDGGSISLSTAGGVNVADGARLLLNGGAWRDRSGKLNPGTGGDLSIESTLTTALPDLHLGGTAESYSLNMGGILSMAAGGIDITETGVPGIRDGVWTIAPSFFQQGGFSRYNLTATHLGLRVDEGTQVKPRALNWVLDAGMNTAPTGTPLASLAHLELLPDYLRAPVNLSLSSRRALGESGIDAGLTIAAGAAINTDMGASVNLSSDRMLTIEGAVHAPAGSITLNLGANRGVDPGLFPDKAIWLGPEAELSAIAATRLTPNPLGLRQGEVRDGGSVTLRAQRGFVITAPGSLIDVSGTATTLDIPHTGSAGVSYKPTAVAGAAGTIRVEAPEGMMLAGGMRAQAASTPGAAGGSLAVTLGTGTADPLPPPADQQGEFKYPTGTRELALLTGDPETLFGELQAGDTLFPSENLVALRTLENDVDSNAAISLQQLQQAGFDEIDLAVRPVVRTGGIQVDDARIRFDAGAQLQAGRRITMDAPILAGDGDVLIEAPHIALGPTDTALRFDAAPTGGTGTLTARADLIDLTGDIALQGFGAVGHASLALESRGDVRLTGLRITDTAAPVPNVEITGGLKTEGDLHISAAQVYPTTLSEFTLEATGAQGTVSLDSFPDAGVASIPLSAGGALNVKAENIDVAGTVRAPHGRITLEATDRLSLDDGSVVSVAGPAMPVPYGQTQFGRDWILPYTAGLLRVLGGPNDESWSAALPEKTVELVADNVELHAGAQVVLDGGGDLHAWEFIPGPGGSRDVLLAENADGAYAILPSAQLSSMPLDPFSQYDGLMAGDTIEIADGIDGLPASEYTLLPARYALLPGAFLLTPETGMTGLAPADAYTTPNGFSIVYARRGSELGGTHDSLWSGYIVENGAQVRQRAEYRESLASDFFADTASVAQMSSDAGRLLIDAGSRLSLGAVVQAAGAGRGGQVDIIADRLAVVETATGGEGRVELLADGLSQLRVESLLLGGRREQTADGTRIEAAAQDVSIESGVEMELPEIMLVATADGADDNAGGVRVEAGASLRGIGAEAAAPERFIMEGDSALLRVSSGAAVEIERSSIPALTQAQLVLEDGSALIAGAPVVTGLTGGSITLDSSGDASSSAALNLGTGGALQLAASRISLGDIPAEGVSQGLALSQADLAGLDASNLFLKSASSIDLFGQVDFSVGGTLALNASELRGIANGDPVTASLRAGTLTWNGAGSLSEPDSAAEPGGQLTLAAEVVQLGDGSDAAELAVQGFALTRIEGESGLTVQGDGALQVVGELQLAAPWLTTTNGADWRMDASNALVVTGGVVDAAAPATPGLGSRLKLSGSQLTVDGRVLLPAGSVELRATGADAAGNEIVLTENARIDVAAVQETFLDQTLTTPGGNVILIADHGDVVVEAGAGIDVSGAGGELTVRAQGEAVIDGDLIANANGRDEGTFSLTARNIDNFSALNEELNAGGFGAARHIHLRSGDVTIGSGEMLHARYVSIVLDGEPADGDIAPTGTFALGGTIDASGESAGQVRIHAYGDVDLVDGARIDASASGEDHEGGKVELATVTGRMDIADDAVIDVRGTREVSYERPLLDENGVVIQRTDVDGNPQFAIDGQPLPALERITVADTGQVRYRVPRAALFDGSAQQPSLGGTVLGAGRMELEAFQVYTDADGRLDVADVAATAANPLYQDAVDLMASEADIRAALGVSDDSSFHLVPGVEVRSTGDLTLVSAWDLAQWRFGDNSESGVLSLRAGGDIKLEQALSDGVQRVLDPEFFVEKDTLLDEASWSLRLAAGADLNSIDPLAVSPGSGDLTVGAGVLLRTGTGGIDLRAGRDVELTDTASVIYTAGIDAGIGTLDPLLISLYLDGVYPVLGGDVNIVAHGNVEVAASNQLINDWLWRIGGSDTEIGELPRSWNVNLTNFQQGVAAFGGGNISITADGDVRNLSAAVPTTGRQVGANRVDPLSGTFSVDSDEVVVQGGDVLAVRAGGDIVGGVYYLGRGLGELSAGGSITRQDDGSLYPMLGLGAGRWEVTAGRRAAVETVFNPTLVNQALQQGFVPILGSSFVTYADSSALQLTALAGDARLNQDVSFIRNHPFLANRITELELKQFRLYPGSLQAISFRDDVVINQSLDLFPTPTGQLALIADGSVRAEPNASPTLTMLDAVDAAPLHGDDPNHVRIVARHGNIGGEILNFNLAKSARLDAGGDIRNVRLDVQHLSDQDMTVLRAGGSIVHDTTRAASGVLGTSNLTYRVAGPGHVDFIAGGAIDLGTADGIETRGNNFNPFLPEGGAGVTVAAGLREPPRFDGFIDKYLVAGTEYAAKLATYLEDYTTDAALSDVENFRALPLEQQRPFLWQVFFAELRASGVEGTSSGSDDFGRGFAAIETLFPEQIYADGQVSGDLSLLLSRITTLDGGDINILVPGGAANAGVATSSQLIKPPSELGIVVQGSGDVNAFVREDFAVNQSRVFTLDGGDLLMWSSFGDIDAGRGAKSAITAPPPVVTTDPETGNTIITFPPAIAGSGIRAVVTSEGVEPGDVYLFAPSGVVSAGDAGIGSAGNVTIGAVAVLGADNIDVGGIAVGVPVATNSLAAGLTGVSGLASSVSKNAEELASEGANTSASESASPLADAALTYLEVFVVGFGDEEGEGKDNSDDKDKEKEENK